MPKQNEPKWRKLLQALRNGEVVKRTPCLGDFGGGVFYRVNGGRCSPQVKSLLVRGFVAVVFLPGAGPFDHKHVILTESGVKELNR